MNDAASIKTTLERTIESLASDPGRARRTYRVDAEMETGLRVTTTEGKWRVTMDMPEAMGGASSAPNPGVFARAALLGCVAVGVRLEAAREEIRLDDLAMSLESDGDGRGILGVDGVDPGFESFRLDITVRTPADAARVRAMIDRALARSPWWTVVSKPQHVRADVTIVDSPADE